MQSDGTPEAPGSRRLLVFAALAGAMLVVPNLIFSRDPPLLAPPFTLLFVVFLGSTGILTWVDGRKARALCYSAVAFSAMVAGGTIAGVVADWRAYVALLLALDAVIAWLVVSWTLWRPESRLSKHGLLFLAAGGVAHAGLFGLGLLVGPGPTLAAALGALFILFAWLLRPPVEREPAF